MVRYPLAGTASKAINDKFEVIGLADTVVLDNVIDIYL